MSQARPSDAVDTILQQWARERPDLDASPMAVIGRVGRCAALLRRELEQVFAAFGLSSWEFDVLASLRRSGESRSTRAPASAMSASGVHRKNP